jgi:hypothetical protein
MKKLFVLGSAFVLTFGIAFVAIMTTSQPATAEPPCQMLDEHWYFTTEECVDYNGHPGHLVTQCAGYEQDCWYYDEFGNCLLYSGEWHDCGCVEICYIKPIPVEWEPPIEP